MRPLFAATVEPTFHVELSEVAAEVNGFLEDRYGADRISVRPVQTPEDLAAWEAGKLVLYRKPPRRRGDRITYEDPATGEQVELEQLRVRAE